MFGTCRRACSSTPGMKRKAAAMPIETSRSSAPPAGHSRASGIGPLAIAAALALALHLVSGIMLDRSHAGVATEPTASDASDGEAMGALAAKPPEPTLRYD